LRHKRLSTGGPTDHLMTPVPSPYSGRWGYENQDVAKNGVFHSNLFGRIKNLMVTKYLGLFKFP